MVLLAKSHGGVTIYGHTRNVVLSCQGLWELAGRDILRFYGVPPEDREEFYKIYIASSWLHDIGKANDHFQEMMHHRDFKQAVRHEVVSFLLMNTEPLKSYLIERLGESGFQISSWVVGGHHRKFYPDDIASTNRNAIEVMGDAEDVERILSELSDFLGGEPPGGLSLPRASYECVPIGECFHSTLLPPFIDEIADHLDDSREFPLDERRKKWVPAMKALMITGDVLGSIQDKSPEDVLSLLQKFLRNTCTTETFTKLIEGRRKGGGEWALNKVQRRSSNLPNRVSILEAGCGTGKTIAAYCWGLKHAIGRKLYYNYPTRGTTTAGYQDYALQVEVGSSLLHGASRHDLEALNVQVSDADDPSYVLRNTFEVLAEPLIYCTADTTLGLLQNYHLGILGMAGFANGAYIFDEIHSYDEKMWAALLRFIQLGVPCLLMTATLPNERLIELEDALGDEVLGRLVSNEEIERAPRYIMRESPGVDREYAWSEAEKVMEQGGRVIWITNTVDQCISEFEEAVGRGYSSVCYHARFKNRDRIKNQQTLCQAFKRKLDKDSPRIQIAFATQVAEMSLDLQGADLLITDPCPVTSLIQRLGRLNRDLQSKVGRLIILQGKKSPRPYETDEIQNALEWIKHFPVNEWVSQKDIANWLATAKYDKKNIEVQLCHFDFVQTRIGSLRDAEGLNVEIVLPEDEADVLSGKFSAHDMKIRVHLFRNEHLKWKNLEGHRYIYVPTNDAYDYDPLRGAKKCDFRSKTPCSSILNASALVF